MVLMAAPISCDLVCVDLRLASCQVPEEQESRASCKPDDWHSDDPGSSGAAPVLPPVAASTAAAARPQAPPGPDSSGARASDPPASGAAIYDGSSVPGTDGEEPLVRPGRRLLSVFSGGGGGGGSAGPAPMLLFCNSASGPACGEASGWHKQSAGPYPHVASTLGASAGPPIVPGQLGKAADSPEKVRSQLVRTYVVVGRSD